MPNIGRADEVPSFVRCIDGKDTNKDIDGGERVCEVVRERSLVLAEGAPENWCLVIVEGMLGVRRYGEDERSEEH